MDRPLLVYTTFPDSDTAAAVGESLIKAGLAACINVLPGMRSVYAWKGSVERAEEVSAILKSRVGLKERLREALRAEHPYETPAIFFIEPTAADPDTLAWIMGETQT
jgi:periplasmic divalent cation tolerance protein